MVNEILIYKVIGTGEKQFTAETFVSQLNLIKFAEPGEGVTVRFNSPGGGVFDGFAVISKMEESPYTITGIIDGIAASMAAFIALRCDTLKMNRNAKMMLHLPNTAMSGGADDFRKMADQLDDVKDRFAEIIAQKAGITNEQAIELYLQPGKDVWLTAQEAKAAGLVDEVIGEPAEIPQAATALELFEIYAKLLDTKIENKMDKEKLLALFGAQANAEMTDDEIYALVENAVKASTDQLVEITALKAKVTAFETEKAEARTAEITALLNTAVEEKKMTAQQKPAWQAMFEKDYDNAKALLGTLNPAPSIQGVAKQDDETEADLKAAYKEADRKGTLAKIKAEKPERFKALYKARFGKEPAE